MKRDLELAVKILLELERATPNAALKKVEIEGYDDEAVSYHIKLLDDVGLVDGKDLSTKSGFDWWVRDITWAGHDFLDQQRSDDALSDTKARLTDKAIDKGLDVIFQSLVFGLKSQF